MPIELVFEYLRPLLQDEISEGQVFRLEKRGDTTRILSQGDPIELQENVPSEFIHDTDMLLENDRIWRLAPAAQATNSSSIPSPAEDEPTGTSKPTKTSGHKKRPRGNPKATQMVVCRHIRNPMYDDHVPCRFDDTTPGEDILACRPLLAMSEAYRAKCEAEAAFLKSSEKPEGWDERRKEADVCRRACSAWFARNRGSRGHMDTWAVQTVCLSLTVCAVWRLAVTKDVLKGRVRIYWGQPLVGSGEAAVRKSSKI